jgi:hypothetical protein
MNKIEIIDVVKNIFTDAEIINNGDRDWGSERISVNIDGINFILFKYDLPGDSWYLAYFSNLHSPTISLKDREELVIKYFKEEILPILIEGNRLNKLLINKSGFVMSDNFIKTINRDNNIKEILE